jgi:hypothetical protein
LSVWVASASVLCSSVLVIYSCGLWQRQRMISRQSQLKNAYFRTLNIEAFR